MSADLTQPERVALYAAQQAEWGERQAEIHVDKADISYLTGYADAMHEVVRFIDRMKEGD